MPDLVCRLDLPVGSPDTFDTRRQRFVALGTGTTLVGIPPSCGVSSIPEGDICNTVQIGSASCQRLSNNPNPHMRLRTSVAAAGTWDIAMRRAMARFPFVKPMESFDFAYELSLDKKQVATLGSCDFIEHGVNVIVLESLGVGKTPWPSPLD